MVVIDSLYVPFCYVDKQGEIWTVSFSLTYDQVKINFFPAAPSPNPVARSHLLPNSLFVVTNKQSNWQNQFSIA